MGARHFDSTRPLRITITPGGDIRTNCRFLSLKLTVIGRPSHMLKYLLYLNCVVTKYARIRL